jgi:ribosome-associated protein
VTSTDSSDAPDGVRVTPRVVIPERELSWRFSRSSGPGGQSVNTTDSRVELLWSLDETSALPAELIERARARLGKRLIDGVVVIAASEYKSQLRNRDAACERLAELIRTAIAPPPKPRRPTRPSKAAEERRIESKKRRGTTKRLRQTPTE